jgi:lipase
MRLHLHELGERGGAPVACLHGLTGHGRRYARIAGELPGRRLLAPDLRGHGRSTPDPPWTTEQHVADVLETLPDERMDWIGFSFGGRIAATVAAVAPERVRRLVLLDPALTLAPALAAAKALEALADPSHATAQDAVQAALDSGTLFSTPREFLEEDVAAHYERRPDGRLQARVVQAMAVTAWSEMARPAPPVADPAVPTLVVTGARSWIPVDVAALRATRHVEVPGGHNVLWEDLRLTADAVRAFLA